MILAFAEELGHDHQELMIGASVRRRGNRTDLIDTAAAQITNEADVDSDDEGEGLVEDGSLCSLEVVF